MKNWKSSLLATGVLLAMLAGSAFAATEAEDAATQQKGLEYNNKIEETMKDAPFAQDEEGHRHGCGGPRFRHGGPGYHHGGFHGPHGGPGHRHDRFHGPHGGPGHHHDGFHGPHGGPGHHHDGFHGPHGGPGHFRKGPEKPGRLSPEQRQQLAKEREQFFANWGSMSERERRETTEKFINRVNEERMKNMDENEKKAFEKQQAERKAEREKIAKMTDDERHEYFKKKHEEKVREHTKNMTKEEKERFLERDKRRQARMDEFWAKWKQMTPEEREQWKKDRRRFRPGPGRGGRFSD